MSKSRNIVIRKKSGLEESFDSRKMYNSLISTGVLPDAAHEVIALVEKDLRTGMSTKKIYSLARRHLRRIDQPSGMRYSLKDAIYALGPTGYPFEKFIARLFELRGYKTKVGQLVNGHCVRHEVDVIATGPHEQIMMECKFHQNGNRFSDVKIAMYVDSRFRDIAKALAGRQSAPRKFSGALVTNTRLTSEAIKYASCSGLKAIAWKYPSSGSLEKLIENAGAYPVTILPSASRTVIEKLTRKGLMMVTDINDLAVEALSRQTGLDNRTVERLKTQSLSINR